MSPNTGPKANTTLPLPPLAPQHAIHAPSDLLSNPSAGRPRSLQRSQILPLGTQLRFVALPLRPDLETFEQASYGCATSSSPPRLGKNWAVGDFASTITMLQKAVTVIKGSSDLKQFPMEIGLDINLELQSSKPLQDMATDYRKFGHSLRSSVRAPEHFRYCCPRSNTSVGRLFIFCIPLTRTHRRYLCDMLYKTLPSRDAALRRSGRASSATESSGQYSRYEISTNTVQAA